MIIKELYDFILKINSAKPKLSEEDKRKLEDYINNTKPIKTLLLYEEKRDEDAGK